MSQGREAALRRRTAAGSADHLGGLPDDLLLYVLSFLPSRDAVQTCVLARRWRNLWKDVPALRITPATAARFWSESALNRFVNCLLLFRNRSPLHAAEFYSFDTTGDFEEGFAYLELWVRYSLSCPVAKLCVTTNNDAERWILPKGLITSEHLTTLELYRITSEHDLDFSSCVSLWDLKMDYCDIYCGRIISPSLKRLSIVEPSFLGDVRTRISVPNLISLLLVDVGERTPLLDSMPLLVEAFVRLQDWCSDCCQNSYEFGDCGAESCWGCRHSNYGKNTSVLLHGLSSCTKLELIASPEPFIFRKDLTRCPIFSKLKTLLLNDWCITPNLSALICFLQHSPVLEKLILQLPKIHENLVGIGATYDLTKQPLVLKGLTVEVKCDDYDEQIHKVLGVLCSYGLPPKKIKIQRLPELLGTKFDGTWAWISGSFSFEQEI